MSGDSRVITNPQEQPRAISLSLACFEINAGSGILVQGHSMATSNMMLVSFFVVVLLSVLLHLLLCCLTGLIKLPGLVGLTAQRASIAGQGV